LAKREATLPMADIDILRTLASVIFLFFVPGFFLWKALVPRSTDVADEFPQIYTAAFSIGLSVAVVVLTGIVLGQFPNDASGKGLIQIQYWLPVLLALTAVFAAVAWWRGAFPALGRLSPRLARRPRAPSDGTGVADDPKRYWREQDLLARRLEVRAQLKRKERAGRATSEDRGYYQKQRAELTAELVRIDEDLEKLRAERDRQIGEAEEQALKLEADRRERRDTLLRFLHLQRPAAKDAPASKGK
jgi:uncharacterized protein DUF1616